jgi:hypothetical protein
MSCDGTSPTAGVSNPSGPSSIMGVGPRIGPASTTASSNWAISTGGVSNSNSTCWATTTVAKNATGNVSAHALRREASATTFHKRTTRSSFAESSAEKSGVSAWTERAAFSPMS